MKLEIIFSPVHVEGDAECDLVHEFVKEQSRRRLQRRRRRLQPVGQGHRQLGRRRDGGGRGPRRRSHREFVRKMPLLFSG